jgi:hypothetical protein
MHKIEISLAMPYHHLALFRFLQLGTEIVQLFSGHDSSIGDRSSKKTGLL